MAGDQALSRREQAVARSLFTARARAENRLQRFLDAALELMNEGESGRDFTVHEVVERSGQSLRLFYQYFGGKHELLLALFEESVRSTAEFLQRQDRRGDRPARAHPPLRDRVLPALPSSAPGRALVQPLATAWVMVDFAQQLLTSHPTEAALAFDPLVSLFGEVLDEAEAAGCIRPGLRRSPIAGMVLEAIMFNAFSTTIGGTSARTVDPDPAEELWEFILHGVGSTKTTGRRLALHRPVAAGSRRPGRRPGRTDQAFGLGPRRLPSPPQEVVSRPTTAWATSSASRSGSSLPSSAKGTTRSVASRALVDGCGGRPGPAPGSPRSTGRRGWWRRSPRRPPGTGPPPPSSEPGPPAVASLAI